MWSLMNLRQWKWKHFAKLKNNVVSVRSLYEANDAEQCESVAIFRGNYRRNNYSKIVMRNQSETQYFHSKYSVMLEL